MDSKNIGNIISKLRKKNGMTQCELARQLSVTDKAVSRWENGQGFPDITIFPRLAELFGVSIDYLMLGDKKGITVAGNMILDIVKSIAEYPSCGRLAYVSDISYAVGGCAPNTAIDLAKIDPTIPISVIGKVGTDENGRFILSHLQQNGINVNKVSFSYNTPTGFCDVMSIPSGERTFFCKKGTNATFAPEDVDKPVLWLVERAVSYIKRK
jgi:transcriptional regulator with XRE-family HTH domain